MTKPLLYIGDKHISSWSLRPWLALSVSGIAFDEKIIHLYRDDTHTELAKISPSRRVPVLEHGSVRVWESLAICEYIAETWPDAQLWPVAPSARAVARAVSNEMHAGFQALRQECTFAITERKERVLGDDAQANVRRITALWRDCRAEFGAGGPFLFGRFSVADAMYAPVVSRFTTYGIGVDAECRGYMDAVWALPAMRAWESAARAEVSAKATHIKPMTK